MARTAATPSFLGGARGVRAVDAGTAMWMWTQSLWLSFIFSGPVELW